MNKFTPTTVKIIFQYHGDKESNVVLSSYQAVVPSVRANMQTLTGFQEPIFVFNDTTLNKKASAQSLGLEDGSLIHIYEHGPADLITFHIVNQDEEWPTLRDCQATLDTKMSTIIDLYVGRFESIAKVDIQFLRKGQQVLPEDTLRILGMTSNSKLEVVTANKVSTADDRQLPFGDDGHQQRPHITNPGPIEEDEDSLFVPEARLQPQAASSAAAAAAALHRRQLTETPPPSLKTAAPKIARLKTPKTQKVYISDSSQQSLDRLRQSTEYDHLSPVSSASRRATLFGDLDQPLLIKPDSITKATEYDDGRTRYSIEPDRSQHSCREGQYNWGVGRSHFRATSRASHAAIDEVGEDRSQSRSYSVATSVFGRKACFSALPHREQYIRSHLASDFRPRPLDEPAEASRSASPRRHRHGSKAEEPGRSESRLRHNYSSSTEKSRAAEPRRRHRRGSQLTEASREALGDIGMGVRPYLMESSKGRRSISPDYGPPSPKCKRRTPNLMPPPPPPSRKVLLVFKHAQERFAAFSITTRSDKPLGPATEAYARHFRCLIEDLDFTTESGAMIWDGAADTPIEYGLENGDTVMVSDAGERLRRLRGAP